METAARFKFYLRLPLKNYNPLVILLVIPEVRGRFMPLGDYPFDSNPLAGADSLNKLCF